MMRTAPFETSLRYLPTPEIVLAGADAGNEVRDLALGVAPHLGTRGLVVAEWPVGGWSTGWA